MTCNVCVSSWAIVSEGIISASPGSCGRDCVGPPRLESRARESSLLLEGVHATLGEVGNEYK